MTKVDRKDCVQFIVHQDEFRGGVDKMKRIFRNLLGYGNFTDGTNISAGVGAPILVPMTECYLPHVKKSFWLMVYDEDEIDGRHTLDKIWHGVVDRNFRLWVFWNWWRRSLMSDESFSGLRSCWSPLHPLIVWNNWRSRTILRGDQRIELTFRCTSNILEYWTHSMPSSNFPRKSRHSPPRRTSTQRWD